MSDEATKKVITNIVIEMEVPESNVTEEVLATYKTRVETGIREMADPEAITKVEIEIK